MHYSKKVLKAANDYIVIEKELIEEFPDKLRSCPSKTVTTKFLFVQIFWACFQQRKKISNLLKTTNN